MKIFQKPIVKWSLIALAVIAAIVIIRRILNSAKAKSMGSVANDPSQPGVGSPWPADQPIPPGYSWKAQNALKAGEYIPMGTPDFGVSSKTILGWLWEIKYQQTGEAAAKWQADIAAGAQQNGWDIQKQWAHAAAYQAFAHNQQ